MATEERTTMHGGPGWADDVFDVLIASHVRQVAYVPDQGHARLIERCIGSVAMKTVCLTTEEEGVALVSGAWLGGDRGVLLMQSSGVGNCVNMLGMTRECRFPFLALVTMRGEAGEFNPWQVPMGRATPAVLEAMGVDVRRVDRAEEAADVVRGAARDAFDGLAAVAVLIGRSVLGQKEWK